MAYTIDSQAGILGVKEGAGGGGGLVGKLKLGTGIRRLEAGWRGVVESGGDSAVAREEEERANKHPWM
jgi:hypothetical protein